MIDWSTVNTFLIALTGLIVVVAHYLTQKMNEQRAAHQVQETKKAVAKVTEAVADSVNSNTDTIVTAAQSAKLDNLEELGKWRQERDELKRQVEELLTIVKGKPPTAATTLHPTEQAPAPKGG